MKERAGWRTRALKNTNTGRDLCKLTGQRGKFVESHLIPKALTKPTESGSAFVQAEIGRRPVRRWSSWYDKQLVIQSGEDILSSSDSWAIPELRKHKLVWSGWGPAQVPPNIQMLAGIWAATPMNSNWGYRVIRGIDPRQLRLFFLSLLWRAAATDRSEFSQVAMPRDDLERLRLMLINGNPDPLSFYPTELCQFSTMGVFHNRAPITMSKTIKSQVGEEKFGVAMFRFYLDGLMAHVHRKASNIDRTAWFGSSIVGAGDELVVANVPFETSFQDESLRRVIADGANQHQSRQAGATR